MSFNQAGKALIASVLTISSIAAPVFQQGTFTEAAAKVKLNKTECSLTVGGTVKLKLKGADAVKFKSSDSKIATVSKSGKVKAKKAGTATISVYDEKGNVYKCKITVAKKGSSTEKDYGDIDLGGMEIIIRDWWHPSEPEDPRNEYEEVREKYRKDMMEKYNFTIREVAISDWGAASKDFVDYVSAGGDNNNYIFTLHTEANVVTAMNDGLMYDLSTLDCLDFTEEKFNRNKLHLQYSIGSSIYAFFGGYCEPTTGVYFNKQVLRNAGIDPDSIYEAQKNGTWTWDMFDKVMAQCQRDLDGDGEDDIYGVTMNEVIFNQAAVLSNGGAFIGKDKNGKYTYELESEETLEALNWALDIYAKYDDHTPSDASWDYYMQEWREGKAAFLVDQEYCASPGNYYQDSDFDMGFVMFPKGPKSKDYVSMFSCNAYVIPACYDAERAWKIAFAWNLYTNPVPGYEDYSEYIEADRKGNFDRRTLEETLPMMSDPKRGTPVYSDFVPGIDLGPDFTWALVPGIDLDSLIESCRDKWKKAIKEANKKIK